ncbi:hypothetical protein BT96DRAFT_984636 [Gymnopus androsaceus JB14]|uniref:Uncharacterized protein n=1 Tax=Gymnopus androsaceus JB14 TaxID=1447944 RepID=A0A6A4IG73_9AGAR|nr:hypothetical protein BT96DRAFT_984636 [Gymnopus androsaceus JB14]
MNVHALGGDEEDDHSDPDTQSSCRRMYPNGSTSLDLEGHSSEAESIKSRAIDVDIVARGIDVPDASYIPRDQAIPRPIQSLTTVLLYRLPGLTEGAT